MVREETKALFAALRSKLGQRTLAGSGTSRSLRAGGPGVTPGRHYCSQLDGLTEWVKSNPPEVVAARLKELDEALGKMLDDERDRELRELTAE